MVQWIDSFLKLLHFLFKCEIVPSVRLDIGFSVRDAKKFITKARNVLKANAAKIENTKGKSLDGRQLDFQVFVSCFRTFVIDLNSSNRTARNCWGHPETAWRVRDWGLRPLGFDIFSP